ncbi:MAG TPA: glycosyltransferase, partial [Acidimicrobiales bacterium]|nr:glycosyltransferase [Acidimicrobiales bacterium]
MKRPSSVPVVVVPCYNEAARLSPEGFASLVSTGRVALLFVDDGSTDDTVAVLEHMAQELRRYTSVEVFCLPENSGKAEAVRQGMLRAVRNG